MTSKRYLVWMAGSTLFLCGLIAGTAWWLNDFGLWRHRSHARIWTLEKTSKYLLAHRYVPENFDGLLLGPSLAANINPAGFPTARYYNLAMQAANITEVAAAADPALQSGRIREVLVCINAYWIKNHGTKEGQIHPKEYFGSLFSQLPFRMLKARYEAGRNPDADPFHDSENGFNDFHRLKRHIKFAEYERTHPYVPDIEMDPEALVELDQLLQRIRSHGARVLAYYHPAPKRRQQIVQPTQDWALFEQAMNRILRPGELICDFRRPEYDYITADDLNYSDGHLSERGATLVAGALAEALRSPVVATTPRAD